MSTTYTAKGTFNDSVMNDEDKALVNIYKEMYANAQDDTAKKAAHAGAEAVRSKYGYSGGADGSERIETPKVANDNSDYLQQMYNAKKEAGLAALKAAYDKNVTAVDAAGKKIPGVYDSARNRAAASAAQAQRNFNQQAAATGLGSGTSAQAQLANSVALQGNLNEINTAESNALAELELQRTNIATEYENAVAQAEANGNYELAAALYQEAIRVDEFYTAQQKQLDAQKQQDYKNGLEMAQYLFKNTGDASGLKAYGYSDEQIANLQSQWKIDNTPSVPGTSEADAKKALQAAELLYETTGDASALGKIYGYTAEQIRNMEKNWYEEHGYDYTGDTPVTEPVVTPTQYTDRDFVNIQNVVSSYLQQRDLDGLYAYLAPIIPNFTDSQNAKLDKILIAYGIYPET